MESWEKRNASQARTRSACSHGTLCWRHLSTLKAERYVDIFISCFLRCLSDDLTYQRNVSNPRTINTRHSATHTYFILITFFLRSAWNSSLFNFHPISTNPHILFCTALHSTQVIMIANDVTVQSGSFGVLEDDFFFKASVYARERGTQNWDLTRNHHHTTSHNTTWPCHESNPAIPLTTAMSLLPPSNSMLTHSVSSSSLF